MIFVRKKNKKKIVKKLSQVVLIANICSTQFEFNPIVYQNR